MGMVHANLSGLNSGGYASGQPITLYTHNYTGVTSGMPMLNYVQGPFSSFARGEGNWVNVSKTIIDRMLAGTARGIAIYREDQPLEDQNPVKTYPEVVKGIYITGLVHVTADTAVIRERATNMVNITGTFEKGHEFLMAGAFTGWYEVVHEEKRRYI